MVEGWCYHLHFKSGNSPEIKRLSPFKTFWQYANHITNITSFLGSDFVLNTTVETEACPNNLAPTNSTTAQLVMGDAIAFVWWWKFQFKEFRKIPSRRCFRQKIIAKLRHVGTYFKTYGFSDTSIKGDFWNLRETSRCYCGCRTRKIGIITDGDIRRMLNERDSLQI
jgi:arabinose-5-phosphate isomerase